MEQTEAIERPIKTALFVDFDNIYLGLEKMDERAAEVFATNPARWLKWVEQGMQNHEGNGSPKPRRRAVLVRRCYLNPQSFQRFRPDFIRAAFTVIDCPSWTQQGKNSSDIQMVMDILDTLTHETRFGEFIIFSGDSDFTPVLLKLRAHDRQTAILTAGTVVAAYKSASDLVIRGEVFIEEALGIRSADYEPSIGKVPTSESLERILDAMARRVYAEASTNGEILGTALPHLFSEFPEFKSGKDWLGFFSLRNLTAELVRRRPELLRLVEGDPWRVAVNIPAPPAYPPESLGTALESGATAIAALVSNEDLKTQIVNVVKKYVASAPAPVKLATVSQYVIRTLGPRAKALWTEEGSFKILLQSVEGLGLEIVTLPQPGYIFDPQRHVRPPIGNGSSEIPEEAEEVDLIPDDELKAKIIEQVKQIISDSSEPVVMGEVASQVIAKLGSQLIESQWAGEGTFKNLLQNAATNIGLNLAATWEPPGYVYDPSRHERPTPSLLSDKFRGLPDELVAFTRRVNQLTSAPRLTPEQYALVFRLISEEVQRVAYNLTVTSRTVRDRCIEQGESISRASISFILQGITYAGHWFGKSPDGDSPIALAQAFKQNVIDLCGRAQLDLDESQQAMLNEWISGKLQDCSMPIVNASEYSSSG